MELGQRFWGFSVLPHGVVVEATDSLRAAARPVPVLLTVMKQSERVLQRE